MHAARLLPLTVVLAAACAGLDPRRLECLEPGMDRATVAATLEREDCAIPVMRFFVDLAGREREVLIDVYDGGDDATTYALLSIDGGFAAATVASDSPVFFEGQWWRDRGRSHAELQQIVADATGPRRVPLAWNELEQIDRAHRASGRHTGDAMAVLLVIPLVIYLPYWAWTNTFGDDGSEQAHAARTFLLAAPRSTSAEQVIAALGPPASDETRDDAGTTARTLHYVCGRYTIEAGFRAGRLQWVDLGCWFDWAPAFIR